MAKRLREPAADPAPYLVWPGRDDRRVVLCDADGGTRRVDPKRIPAGRLHELERHGGADNLVIRGDNYPVHRALLADGWAGRFALAYLDPPFGTGRRFEHYADALSPGDYLSMLRDRLIQVRELLSPRGTLVVHLDDHRVHHVRLLLDELFGPRNFRSSIVVKRVYKNVGRQFEQISALPLAHDLCLVYSREPATRYPRPEVPKPDGPRHPAGYWKDFWSTADRPTMRYDLLGVTPVRGQWKWCRARAEAAVANYHAHDGSVEPLVEHWRRHGRRPEYIRRSPRGRVEHWVPPLETQVADTLWTDLRGYSFGHRFATEKSEALLGRLLEFFSAPGDWVLDSFAGSGTTAAAAAARDRRFVAIELGEQAVTHIVPRLTGQGAEFRLCELAQ